jgi:hypothetical protein
LRSSCTSRPTAPPQLYLLLIPTGEYRVQGGRKTSHPPQTKPRSCCKQPFAQQSCLRCKTKGCQRTAERHSGIARTSPRCSHCLSAARMPRRRNFLVAPRLCWRQSCPFPVLRWTVPAGTHRPPRSFGLVPPWHRSQTAPADIPSAAPGPRGSCGRHRNSQMTLEHLLHEAAIST